MQTKKNKKTRGGGGGKETKESYSVLTPKQKNDVTIESSSVFHKFCNILSQAYDCTNMHTRVCIYILYSHVCTST